MGGFVVMKVYVVKCYPRNSRHSINMIIFDSEYAANDYIEGQLDIEYNAEFFKYEVEEYEVHY